MAFNRRFTLAALVLLAFVLVAQTAAAHLVITPMRFVFENKTRSLNMIVVNGDTKPHSYRLGWKLMKMDETGQYQDIAMDDSPYSVPKMVFFSPRTLTMAAGGQQTIRLGLRRPADLPPGEYRGHVFFEDVTPKEETSNAAAEQSSGVKINVTLNFTAPVIVRSGTIKTGEISIGAPALQKDAAGQTMLNLAISHTQGAASAYGRIVVKAKGKEIGILNNVALYPEMEKRILNVPLTGDAGGGVEISYIGAGEYKGQTFATKQASLQ